jgi:glycosyltransferase involved in cell wall biosynthesis
MAAQAGISARTTFLGALPQTILAEAYRRAHIVVLPSDSEFLPSVLTEAMLCGTPVIATDVGAVREQVAQFGIVVPPGNAAALADAIARVIRDYGSFSALSEAMSRSARQRYSVESMLDAHEELYSRVTRRAPPPIRLRSSRIAGIGTRAAFKVWESSRAVTRLRRLPGAKQ